MWSWCLCITHLNSIFIPSPFPLPSIHPLTFLPFLCMFTNSAQGFETCMSSFLNLWMILNLFTFTVSWVNIFHSGWLKTNQSNRLRRGGRLNQWLKQSAPRDEELMGAVRSSPARILWSLLAHGVGLCSTRPFAHPLHTSDTWELWGFLTLLQLGLRICVI